MKVLEVGEPPRIRWTGRGSIWVLLDPYWLRLDKGNGNILLVEVPADFETDGPSVPNRLASFFPNRSPSFHASIFHDWIYSEGRRWWEERGFGRREADSLFYEVNRVLGTPLVSSWWGWLGVAVGGWTKY